LSPCAFSQASGISWAFQDADKAFAARVFFREIVQNIDKRHGIPAHRKPPCMGACASFLVGPALLLGLGPAVMEHTGFSVASAPFHPGKLIGNIVPVVFIPDKGILGIERLSHIQAIEPHLPRIDLFMPESAFLCARVLFEFKRIRSTAFLYFSLPVTRCKVSKERPGVTLSRLYSSGLYLDKSSAALNQKSMPRSMKSKYFGFPVARQTC
jgi:hypothetical protein